MEFLNWCAEHPFLTFFAMGCVAWSCEGLGRIGSTRVTVKVNRKKADADG